MKTFKYPKQNDHDEIAVVESRLKAEYGLEPILLPMRGIELSEKRKDKDSWPRKIPVLIYRTGQIYHVVSFNDSLNTVCPMLKCVLDEAEQAEFDRFLAGIEYQKALDFLIENTF